MHGVAVKELDDLVHGRGGTCSDEMFGSPDDGGATCFRIDECEMQSMPPVVVVVWLKKGLRLVEQQSVDGFWWL